jgi:tRNA-modifying protein YgfZ
MGIMLHSTPLGKLHEEYARSLHEREPVAGAHRPGAATGQPAGVLALERLPWGPPDEQGEALCEIIATYGEPEAEYAAIRRGAGLFDAPHRGTLLISGGERRDFLNRMVTADLHGLAAGSVKRAFWLNRKGRIDADLVLAELGDCIYATVDIHQAASAAKSLSEFVFAEDVEVRDVSAERHHVQVHGRGALDVIGTDLDVECAAKVTIGGCEVVVIRQDATGEIGLELIMRRDDAPAVWNALLETDERLSEGKRRVRPIGWYAFNAARIEGGTPLFNIDFGPTNLPHETGVLHDRVSFTKGCYLGQEVVARMESRGRPKQVLVGLRMRRDLLPVAGGQVFAKVTEAMGDQVGVVTSSTLSPMLGAAPIAFAMLRTKHSQDGECVIVNAEGEQTEAVVQALRFLPERATEGEA